MLNSKNQRELCYVVKIDDIKPIEGKDRVECAIVGGWTVMVRKEQFKVGDLGIYFEIDSKVPEEEPFMFLESKHFKIKTQKYKTPAGQFWSQGLLMSAEDFGWTKVNHPFADEVASLIDTDGNAHAVDDESRFLTGQLKVTYSVVEDNIRKSNSADKYKKMAQRHSKLFSKKFIKWMMRYKAGRRILFALFGNKRDKRTGWPAWVTKTDEERVENMPWILNNKNPWVATEKIDGTSTTFTLKRNRWKKNEFYVCSRNVVFDMPDKKCYYNTNVYTEMAERYNIREALSLILAYHPEYEWVTLQGETYGDGIQKRNYSLNEHRFMGFNFITSADGRWDTVKAKEYIERFNIPWVPVLNECYTLPDTIEELREYVHSEPSTVDGIIKEGIVFRSQDGKTSFKCVDPEFLMKYHA